MLETAKVDVRRLQLLNDRINQTIDALNQLRLSVHGLQHTTNVGMGQVGVPYGQSVGLQGVPGAVQVGVSNVQGVGQQLGVSNVPNVGVNGVVGQTAFGLGHSTFVPQMASVQQPWTVATMSPVAVGAMGVSPVVGTVGVNPVVGAVGVSPFANVANVGVASVGGLSHTDVNDAYVTLRAVQTFPYLLSPVSPVLPF
ncbi:hypothetical protein L6R52_36840 [Myxococcota bacterium]|nr:hypothetical protein [Myxococcota bacterium]